MINLKEISIAYWRLQKWVSAVEVERKMAAESSLRVLKDYLSENEIEIIDLTGKLYDPGLSVEVMYFEDEKAEGDNTPTIVEMMRPIIIQKGSVIEFGQVVIAKNPQNVINKEPEVKMPMVDAEVDSLINEKEEKLKNSTHESVKIYSLIPSLISVITCIIIFVLLFLQTKSLDTKLESLLKSQPQVQPASAQYQAESEKNLVNMKEGNSNKNGVDSISWQTYIIKPGDTLSSICLNFKIDYKAWETIILHTNGIEDSDKIYTGQAVLLPMLSEGE